MILIASKGQRFTHMPQPMHKISEMKHIVEVFVTSMHNLSALFTGHVFLHSRPHFLGLHLSGFIIAIRNFSSTDSFSFFLETIFNNNQYLYLTFWAY